MPMKNCAAVLLLAGALSWNGATRAEAPLVPPEFLVTIEHQAESWWDWANAGFDSLLTLFLPPSPAEVARRLNVEASVFWGLLADAGYELEKVETSTGVIPGVSATFRMARELTESDRDWVERRLDELARQEGGLVVGLQRSVILMLLGAAETDTFRVERLRVVLSPVPSAQFTLKPTVPQAVPELPPGMLSLHQRAP